MALVKLPDGQIVDKDLIESVERFEDQFGGFAVIIKLRSKRDLVLGCDTHDALDEMLSKVTQALGL